MKKKSSLVRIFKFMKKNLFIYIFSVLALSLVYLSLNIFIATLLKGMFEAITNKDKTGLINVCLYLVIIVVIIFAVYPVFQYIYRLINVKTTGDIRKVIFQKLGKLPLSYYKDNHSGDLVSRMTNDISELEKVYSRHIIQLSIGIISGIGSIIYITIVDWRLAIIAISSGLIILFINLYYSKLLRSISVKVQEKLANLNITLTNILDGIHVIKSFNIHKVIIKKYLNNNDEVYDTSKVRVHRTAVVESLNEMVSIISFMGIAAAGAYLAINGQISTSSIMAVVQMQNGIIMFVSILGTFVSRIQSSLAAADRVFEVLDEKEEPDRYSILSNKEGLKNMAIEFKNVTFNYDDEKILNNLSLSLPKGKIYALAGPSGGGKSTIFKLMLNFFPPKAGNIYINETSIGDQLIKDIRNNIAYVPQDAYLFTGTILDNIAYGKKNATMEEIENAAKLANAHNFIVEMENGYNTLVGERGSQLSGGQRQRIAIARAILKDAPILLLDEATSALDTESESLVQEALNKLMIGRSTLVIAHRLSTIQNADQILVLSNGSIMERGTHSELLNIKDGIYKKLYDLQFKNKEKAIAG